MITYPNQKIITVCKETGEGFLQINIKNWQKASMQLTYSAFKIYLYMAGNKNGYKFALSYEDINTQIPMNRKTYEKAIAELKKYKYLQFVGGNAWMFYDYTDIDGLLP
jgi:Zn/Cd-binding protein ZinT